MFRLILITLLFLTPAKANTQEKLRIISLAPNLTELVYSAGAGDYLIATDSFSNYPEEVKNLPKVGNLHSLNLEEILQLKPDLVLIWQDGLTQQALKRFNQLNIQVKVFHSHKLEAIPQIIRELADLAKRETGLIKAQELEEFIQQTKIHFTPLPVQSYFIQILDKPLLSLTKNQFFSQALELCNLKNIINTQEMAPQINLEEVLQQNPDLILLSSSSNRVKSWKNSWEKYNQLKAVKNKQIYELTEPDIYHRPSERLIRAIPELCNLLNPLKLHANL